MILSKKNPHYTFSLLNKPNNVKFYKNKITTLFVIKGVLNLDLGNEIIVLNELEGITLSPNSTLKEIYSMDNLELIQVVSEKKTDSCFEFVDKENKISESEILNFKILKNHKKVVKPWGHELWIIWLKDYHVLKQIYMKKNFKCSLQFHKEKYETNYLISGRAKILKNFHVNVKNSALSAKKLIENVNLIKDYSKNFNAPYYFTNIPGEVHRVYSLKDYTAYEVSTPELDDVIRLSDDSNRKSGRISSEHKNEV